jgi:hypothetical protein
MRRDYASALTPASWRRPGAWPTGYSSMGAASLCPITATFAIRSYTWHTRLAMRVCRRPSIVFVRISSSLAIVHWCKLGYGRV